MPTCSFCGKKEARKMYVKIDGTQKYYCSSKCEKNTELGRNPRKVNWVRKEIKAE